MRSLSFLTRLWRERRGNVMMIAGFALIPLTYATGMVIDYSTAGRLQSKLNAAADAAALSATTTPMMDKGVKSACNAARRTFRNALEQYKSGLIFDNANLKISVAETYSGTPDATLTCGLVDEVIPNTILQPATRTVTVTYDANSRNAFGGILGSDTIAIGGVATAKAKRPPFIDIHIALDTSQSMGLAATNQGQKDLYTKTLALNGKGCAFGCHSTTGGQPYANETIAKNNNIRMRVDVMRDATIDMLQSAIAQQGAKTLYRFGLYRIGTQLTDITALTTDLAKVKTDAAAVGLGPNNANGVGDTNLPDVTTSMYTKISAKGDGSNQSSARAFLFIITDGVKDVQGACTSGHCTGPIDPTTCQRYKDAGITVGVVYTTFLPILDNPTNGSTTLEGNYVSLVKPFADQIKPKLQSCASTGWFFEGSDEDSITAAMDQLFAQASKYATLEK